MDTQEPDRPDPLTHASNLTPYGDYNDNNDNDDEPPDVCYNLRPQVSGKEIKEVSGRHPRATGDKEWSGDKANRPGTRLGRRGK